MKYMYFVGAALCFVFGNFIGIWLSNRTPNKNTIEQKITKNDSLIARDTLAPYVPGWAFTSNLKTLTICFRLTDSGVLWGSRNFDNGTYAKPGMPLKITSGKYEIHIREIPNYHPDGLDGVDFNSCIDHDLILYSSKNEVSSDGIKKTDFPSLFSKKGVIDTDTPWKEDFDMRNLPATPPSSEDSPIITKPYGSSIVDKILKKIKH
jgi:hypothetical protein